MKLGVSESAGVSPPYDEALLFRQNTVELCVTIENGKCQEPLGDEGTIRAVGEPLRYVFLPCWSTSNSLYVPHSALKRILSSVYT